MIYNMETIKEDLKRVVKEINDIVIGKGDERNLPDLELELDSLEGKLKDMIEDMK